MSLTQKAIHKKIFRFTFIIISILSILSSVLLTTNAAQNSESYKLPFRSGEVWKAGAQGMHTDDKGISFDFFPTNGANEIFSPADGVLTRGCTVGNQTILNLDVGNGDSFRFVHMAADTVGLNEGQRKNVKQGEFIGKLFMQDGYFTQGYCFFYSEGAHLHMSFPLSMCNLRIDGYNFDCGNLRDCSNGGYKVNCNDQYLGQTFRSTNQVSGWNPSTISGSQSANSSGDYCEQLKSRSWSIGQSGKDVYDLQFCLQNRNLFKYPEGFTSYFGNYTQARLIDWKNGLQKPSDENTSQPTAASNSNNGVITINLVGGNGGNGGNSNSQTQVTNQPQPSTCDELKNKNYTFGSTSDDIKKLQDCMTSNGYFKHPFGSTGYFGSVTQTALNNWKNGSSQPVAQNNNSCDNLKNQNYPFGETSDRVKQLQICMTGNGYFKHSAGATGYFGPVTQSALNNWKNNNSGVVLVKIN
jgi:peptidoglycan hydrolase-like protein with peptidoglycan-binding domain